MKKEDILSEIKRTAKENGSEKMLDLLTSDGYTMYIQKEVI